MTDKERLEEIKKHRNEADNSTDDYEFEKINFYNLHVDWLIEQAERVQELEGTVKHAMKAIDNTEAVRVKLINAEQQNKRYQKAIKECLERMNKGGAGTRSFVYETLKKALEGEE